MKRCFRLLAAVAVGTVFAFPDAALSGRPDEKLSELIKVEEENLQYLEKKQDFYRLLLDESIVLYCIPNDPFDDPKAGLPGDTRIFWTQKFGLAIWKNRDEFRRAITWMQQKAGRENGQAVEQAIREGLEFSNAYKQDISMVIEDLERRIQDKKLAIEGLKKKQKEESARGGPAAGRYFLDSDFDIIRPAIRPIVIRKKWITDRPTDSLMMTCSWWMNNDITVVIAIEAYESDIVAQVMFEDRAKALSANYQKDRKNRAERGGPTGHFKLDSGLERCDSWLPEEGSTWLGSRLRARRFRNALITISASYIDPVEEDRLVSLLDDLENQTMTVVEMARSRSDARGAGTGDRPRSGRARRP